MCVLMGRTLTQGGVHEVDLVHFYVVAGTGCKSRVNDVKLKIDAILSLFHDVWIQKAEFQSSCIMFGVQNQLAKTGMSNQENCRCKVFPGVCRS